MSARGRSEHAEPSKQQPLGWLANAILRHKRLFWLVLLLVIVLSAVVTALQPRQYVAQAEVLPWSQSKDTEIERLVSQDMAARVAARLPANIISTIQAPSMIERATNAGPPPGGNLVSRVPAKAVTEALQRGISASQRREALSLIVSFTAPDSGSAAFVANAYAEQYVAMDPKASPSSGRIVSAATPPPAASSPNPLLNMLLGSVVGLILGVTSAGLAERRVKGLTTAEDIRDRLGLRHLGSVPELKSAPGRSPVETLMSYPRSAFTETFRRLLSDVESASPQPVQVIAICSALADEGRTTIAFCLARVIALKQMSVVLVDCDPLGGQLSQRAASHPRNILPDVLEGRASLQDALVQDEQTGLSVLSAAASNQAVEQLSAKQSAEILRQLRSRFDYVILVSGSLSSQSVLSHMAALADLAIVVVRWRSTPVTLAKFVIDMLKDNNVAIAGVNLSRVDQTTQKRLSGADVSAFESYFKNYYKEN